MKNIDSTGKPQHGFKSKHSTATAGMKLQSIIPRALNDNEYALMSTLDAHRCGEFKTDHQKTYHGLAQWHSLVSQQMVDKFIFYVSLTTEENWANDYQG